jgi:hypothetical protein
VFGGVSLAFGLIRLGWFAVNLVRPTPQSPADADHRDRERELEQAAIAALDGRIRGAYSLRALFEHVERHGIRLTKTMRAQRARFVDSAERV